MAWMETFHCDVCGKENSEDSQDWWLAWSEKLTPAEGEAQLRVMKVTQWNGFLAHSAEIRHLCGAQCVHRFMDRWMLARD